MVSDISGTTLQHFDRLEHSEILHAPALPFKRLTFYADMALITSKGDTKIFAEAADLSNGQEAFFLNLDDYDGDMYWPDKQGVSAWPPRQDEKKNWTAVDLVTDIKKSGLGAILVGDRKVRLYRDCSASQVGCNGILQSASALSLAGKNGQIVIYATPEFPCSLEVAWEPLRIKSILTDLEEFHLDRH